jgi:hypothetical protein
VLSSLSSPELSIKRWDINQSITMADVPKAPLGGDTSAHKSRPEKPGEEQYKSDLAKAEKEHAAAQEELVGYHHPPLITPDSYPMQALSLPRY